LRRVRHSGTVITLYHTVSVKVGGHDDIQEQIGATGVFAEALPGAARRDIRLSVVVDVGEREASAELGGRDSVRHAQAADHKAGGPVEEIDPSVSHMVG
jgi:hypothetical protein